jgi:hypothetical protein
MRMSPNCGKRRCSSDREDQRRGRQRPQDHKRARQRGLNMENQRDSVVPAPTKGVQISRSGPASEWRTALGASFSLLGKRTRAPEGDKAVDLEIESKVALVKYGAPGHCGNVQGMEHKYRTPMMGAMMKAMRASALSQETLAADRAFTWTLHFSPDDPNTPQVYVQLFKFVATGAFFPEVHRSSETEFPDENDPGWRPVCPASGRDWPSPLGP